MYSWLRRKYFCPQGWHSIHHVATSASHRFYWCHDCPLEVTEEW